MKNILSILLTLFSLCSFAQTDQAEINEQVWKPFEKAIMNQDVTAFVALQRTDSCRNQSQQSDGVR